MGYGITIGCPVGVVEPGLALGKRFVLRLRYGLLLRLEVGVAVGVSEVLVLAVALATAVLTEGGLLEDMEDALDIPPFFEGEKRLGSRLGSTFDWFAEDADALVAAAAFWAATAASATFRMLSIDGERMW
jgi:hypothetical protein